MIRFENRKSILVILVLLSLAVQTGNLPYLAAKTDAPIPGVMIFATNPGGSGSNVTALNGKYIINQGLPTGNYDVSTFAEGYISQILEQVNVVAGSETGNVNFNLKRSGGISGKVTDSSTGNGVANILVTAYSTGKKGWFGQTDSNGNFKIITNLEPGIYNVTVIIATGFFTKTVSGISVAAGVETTGVNISLSRSAVISGKVRTPAGEPVPGVIVTALSSDGASYTGSATTGLDGGYRIENGLGAGTYTVTAYSGTSFNQVMNVLASVGHETLNVDVTLNITVQPSGAISGLVTDTNNNPIAGATISAGSGHATTDSNGAYTISIGIPTGTYTVTVTASGYKEQSQTGVSVTTGIKTSGINFKLVKNLVLLTGRISGTVTGEDNPLTTKQPSSITCLPSQNNVNLGSTLTVTGGITPPVAGTSVQIRYMANSVDITRTATTGSDGKYSDNYTPTTAGSWTVQATWSGNTQYIGAASQVASFTVTQPPPTTGSIKITILDNAGKLIVGATVSSTTTPSGQDALNSVTGSDGSVSFSSVAAGSYTMQATMTGYTTNTGTVNLVAGGIATSSITLQTQGGGGNPSGGIPGYPYEVITTGVLLGAIVLLWMRRRS